MGILGANMGTDCYTPALQIKGYKLERDNLMMMNTRTRTAVYISEGITYKRRTDLELLNTPLVCLEIKPDKKKSWLIMIGYRQFQCLSDDDKIKSVTMASQLERFSKWCELWKEAENTNKELIITVDLNIDVIPWSNPQTALTENQKAKSKLLNLLKQTANQLNLTLIKTPPTRFQGSDVPSTIDIILTNKPDRISNTQLIQSSSDHKVVLFNKNMEKKGEPPTNKKSKEL